MAGIVNPSSIAPKIETLSRRAAQQTAERLDAAFANAISDSVYQWPNETKRRNGTTVFSPRDIIDTGNLDSSQQLSRNDDVWTWTWNPKSEDGFGYALLVHEGITLRGGGTYKGRRWTARAVKQFRPVTQFARNLRRITRGTKIL